MCSAMSTSSKKETEQVIITKIQSRLHSTGTHTQTDKFGKVRLYLKIHEEDDFPASTTVYSVHFLASWVVYQVIVTGM